MRVCQVFLQWTELSLRWGQWKEHHTFLYLSDQQILEKLRGPWGVPMPPPCCFLTSWQPREHRRHFFSLFYILLWLCLSSHKGSLHKRTLDESRLRNRGMDLRPTFINFRALHLLAWLQRPSRREQRAACASCCPIVLVSNPDFWSLVTFSTFWQAPDW